MMLRYKRSRYATRSNLRQGKATIINVDFESPIPVAVCNKKKKTTIPLLPSAPSITNEPMDTRLPSGRRVSLGSSKGTVTASFAIHKGKTDTNMIFEADDVSMGSISTHSSGFDTTLDEERNVSPAMMVSPMPKADIRAQNNTGTGKFGMPKTLPTATAAIMASSNTIVTPPKRISLGRMSYAPTKTFKSRNTSATNTKIHPSSAFVPVSRPVDSAPANVSPTTITAPILDKAALNQLVMKTPIMEAATALMSLLHSKNVGEDARPQPPQPAKAAAFQPLDLSKGLDQDVSLPGNLPALAETLDDDDEGIDEEVAFHSQRRNSMQEPPIHRPSVKKSLKKKKKFAVKAKKSPIKKSLVKKFSSKTEHETSCYKRIPSKFLSNPTIMLDGMRLAAKGDKDNLNQLHCYVRKELLEVFVLDGSDDGQHRVGLRCVHCGCLPKEKRGGSSMSAFFPKSVEDLYRAVCTWQRIHFKACKVIPEDVKETYWRLKDEDRTRGKKAHWIKTAKNMGFRNLDNDRSGVIWCHSVNSDSQDDDVVMYDAPEPDFDDSEDEEEEVLL